MPVYEFRCTQCGKNFDVLRSREQAGAPAQCPHDGAAGQRLFTSAVVLAATAVYKSMTDLAGQYTGAATEESLVTTSWALVLTMEMLQGAVVLTLSLGIFSLAMAAHRHRLVAGWLGYVAALSAALLIVAGIVDVFAETDVTWTLLMGGLLLLMLWLVVAGFTLVINRKPPVDPSIAPITTPA